MKHGTFNGTMFQKGFQRVSASPNWVSKRFLKSFQSVCNGFLMSFQYISKGLIIKYFLFHQISSLNVARKLLGETCYVGWPHMVEALVMSVCDGEKRYHIGSFI